MGRILEFAELPPSAEMIEFVLKEVDPSRAGKTILNLNEQQLREAAAQMGPLLRELGYIDASASTQAGDSS